ncbi:MAG TPA: GntR family transcriptional regulator [Acidimicrobiales bacterium]|jgi:DNA-binding GntR family transcriptional regulator|nr:GntR family transcriptional regulator [Acidimicrobiales bacterium]
MSTEVSTPLHTAPHTASAIAYQELKSLILLGDAPIGVRLGEERLADRLKMSRTPVREALLRLYAENFVERHPEGGYKATYPSAASMRGLYEVRQALELFALGRNSSDAERDWGAIDALFDEWRTIEPNDTASDAEFVLIDEDFHVRLAESAGNPQLADELRRVNERIRPVRSHDFIAPGRIAATVVQHLEILEVVMDRKLEDASRLLNEHIAESQAVVERAAAKVLERMLSVGERDSSW